MIPRYTRPEMGRIFSDENRFAQWLEVELAASEALAETGEIPADAARALRRHAGFDVARFHECGRRRSRRAGAGRVPRRREFRRFRPRLRLPRVPLRATGQTDSRR